MIDYVRNNIDNAYFKINYLNNSFKQKYSKTNLKKMIHKKIVCSYINMFVYLLTKKFHISNQ